MLRSQILITGKQLGIAARCYASTASATTATRTATRAAAPASTTAAKPATTRTTASAATTRAAVAKPATVTSSSSSAAPASTSAASSASEDALKGIGRKVSGTGSYSFEDWPLEQSPESAAINWSQSFHGLGARPFPEEVTDVLASSIEESEIEIKPDGMIYLPEIKYRRVLNKAFGPGGWGLAPRSETIITPKLITREYALIAHGRLVAVARGEQDYFDVSGIPTATEGCKSNAMMRCCKDLGVASELWDPKFIRKFKKKYAHQVFVEYVPTKRTKSIWMRKDDEVVYPYKKT